MAEYPPYVDAYGSIAKVFEAITKAAVPPKFSQDFIYTVLGLKSTSYRAMIPLLKRLGFIDQGNVPTEAYKRYRDESQSKAVMAAQLKMAYADLYKAHEYAQKLGSAELQNKLRTLLGMGEDDAVVPKVASTFQALAKLADFDAKTPEVSPDTNEKKDNSSNAADSVGTPQESIAKKLGLSYTINLNLPATTEIEVFNAIFRSLKENILE